MCREMYSALSDRPESDQALAINELVETYVTRGVRLQMRAMTYTEREGHVAVRNAGRIYDQVDTDSNYFGV